MRFRDDFPRGWWHSPRWWFVSTTEALDKAILIIAPALLVHRAMFAVRHRRDPAKLARLDGEGFSFGLLAGVGMVAMLLMTTAGQPVVVWFLVGMGAFLILNVLVAGTVCAVLVVSRIRERPDWAAIDFVAKHGAPQRPPETPKEYAAEEMKVFLAGR